MPAGAVARGRDGTSIRTEAGVPTSRVGQRLPLPTANQLQTNSSRLHAATVPTGRDAAKCW